MPSQKITNYTITFNNENHLILVLIILITFLILNNLEMAIKYHVKMTLINQK